MEQFFKQVAEAAATWYDAEGNWIATSRPAIARERYWLAFALYGQGANEFGDAVVRAAKIGYMDNGVRINFDIFHTNIAAILLHKHHAQMAPDVQRILEQRVSEGLVFEPGNRRCDFQIHGYNDNMPAEATLGLILGGEMLGDKDGIEHGLWNLRQLRAMLYRRGIHSEWNSTTYSALTLHCMAEIAEYAQNTEARELACKIEERLWIDLAARFHPEIGMLAGPYSRAYNDGHRGSLTNVGTMMWFVFGDIVRPSPLELFSSPDELCLGHLGDLPFMVAQMCIFAADSYHPPLAATRMIASKTYPFRAVATAEQGDAGPDYPAAPIRIETVLERDYAVGSASIQFLNGDQATPYFLLYKRRSEIRTFRDVGTIYHRFAINDEAPGKISFAKDESGRPYSNSGEEYQPSRCGMATVQAGPTVLAVSHPQISLGGLEDQRAPMPLTRLSEMIIFPSHFGGAEEVRIGARSVAGWAGEAMHGEWIGCRRGRLLLALRPLAYTADLGSVKITLEKIAEYEVIRSNFYEGPERIFTRFDLRRIFGGFLVEHASIDDYPSLAAFMEELAPSKFTDQYLTTRRVRYRRPAGKIRPAAELEISWSPGSPTTRFCSVNGKVPSVEPVVQIDGLETRDLPILNEPWASVPSYFPWPVLRAPCNKHDGVIADRED